MPDRTCRYGHEWTPANTYIHPGRGFRVCRECRRLAAPSQVLAREVSAPQTGWTTPSELAAKLADQHASETPHEWMGQAACRDVDTNLFFPSRSAQGKRDLGQAMRICEACPVRLDCLAFNLHDPNGVFGGTTPRNRRWWRIQMQTMRETA